MGVWEDVPWGALDRDYPDKMVLFSTDPARWSVPESENYDAAAARMEKSLLAMGATYPDKTVAVVSHGLAIRSLLCKILGVPSSQIAEVPYGDNTAVTHLTVENGRLCVDYYNDATHLPEELSTFARQSWWRTKGVAKEEVLLTPMDPRQEAETYNRCYAETWRESHGNLHGFDDRIYLPMAINHARTNPACVTKMTVKGQQAGLIEMDPLRGLERDAGWITLLCIEPSFRGMRLGVQLIGHAVSHFRRQGRHHLRLHVAQSNEKAIGFYEACGFEKAGEAEGVGGALYLMDLDITQRPWTLP